MRQPNTRQPRAIVGYEQFGHVRNALRARGWDAWSCDLMPARDGSPYHFQCDIFEVLDRGWDFGIFHPDCTYFVNSAAWAFRDPDYERYPGVGYHQKIKPETLVGAARRAARDRDFAALMRLKDCKDIPIKVFENPRGYLSTHWRPENQAVQPHQFGHDASKETCFWIEMDGELRLPLLEPTKIIKPRMVNGLPRWANQTDSGQNRLSPGEDRAMLRSETYPGLADAIAEQWGEWIMAKILMDRGRGGMHLSDPNSYKGAKDEQRY